MSNLHVGIDIAKSKFDVAILVLKSVLGFKSFPNTAQGFQELLDWLAVYEYSLEPVFCMEATGRYGENLATFLHNAGYQVSVVNPSCIKNYARSKLRRTKTDKVDAL